MGLTDDRILTSAKEKYPDILLAQLLDTAAPFQHWFVQEVTETDGIERVESVAVNDETGGPRETDVALGFETMDGLNHLVLVENKIKASEQPDQLADYDRRGQRITEKTEYEGYTICLFAPERWLTGGYERKVDSVLTYEQVVDQLEAMEYDGREFIQQVLEESIQESKSGTADYSHVLSELWNRIPSRADRDVVPVKIGPNKQLRFTVDDPEVPDYIVYSIYLANPDDLGHTVVRLQLWFDQDQYGSVPDGKKRELGDRIDRIVRNDHPDLRSRYRNRRTQTRTVIVTKVEHDELPGFESEEYYETVLDEVTDLIDAVESAAREIEFERLYQKLSIDPRSE